MLCMTSLFYTCMMGKGDRLAEQNGGRGNINQREFDDKFRKMQNAKLDETICLRTNKRLALSFWSGDSDSEIGGDTIESHRNFQLTFKRILSFAKRFYRAKHCPPE